MRVLTAVRRRSAAALAAAAVIAASSGLLLVAPGIAQAAPPAWETTVSVTSASADGGLVVGVSGTGYTDLPRPTSGRAAGVYAAIVGHEDTNEYIAANQGSLPAVGWVSTITAGVWSTSLTAATASLSRDGSYDVIVWTAHGNPTDDTVVYRGPLALTDVQLDALFPPTTTTTTTSTTTTSTSTTTTDDPTTTTDDPTTTTSTSTTTTDDPTTTSTSTSTSATGGTMTTTSTSEPTTSTSGPTTTGSTTTTSASKTITGGSLRWGVKQAFRDYVLGSIAHGAITPSGGAALAGGIVTFPNATGAQTGSELSVAVSGSVRFTGHEMGGVPMLDLTLSNLVVTVSGSTGSLSADVRSKSLSTGTFTDLTGVKLADLDLSGHPMTVTGTGVTLAGVPATLTADGAAAFEGFYPAGDDLDPISLTATFGTSGSSTSSTGATASPTASSGTGSSSGQATSTAASVSATTVTAGGQLDVSGGGFTPGEQVQVWLHSDPILITTTTAGADGTAAARITIPTSLEAGAHTVLLKGLESGHTASVGITVVSATPTTQTTGPAQLLNGSLNWGVLGSFRSYISGSIAHGSWSVSGGASDQTGSAGVFSFPLVSGTADADAAAVSASFSGSVRFIGHDMGSGPLLDLTITNPRISAKGTAGTLYVDVRSRGLDDPTAWYQATGVALATLDLSGQDLDGSDGRLDWSDVPVTLSSAGATAFAGFYQAGQAMDALSLSLRVGTAGSASGSGSGGLANTGVPPVGSTLAVALGLVALGLGVTALGRRRRDGAPLWSGLHRGSH